MSIIKLRKLTLKSKIGFGHLKELTVAEVLQRNKEKDLLDKIFGIRWMLDEKHFFPTNRFAAFLLDMAVHQGQLVVDKDIIPLYRLNK